MHSTKLTYEEIDIYLFSQIIGFKDYFFLSGYSTDDLETKYTVMGVLCDFLQNNYLDNTMNSIGDMRELNIILKTLNDIYISGDKKLQELICISFIENLLSSDIEKMKKLKSILKYKNLIDCMVKLYKSWYKIDI